MRIRISFFNAALAAVVVKPHWLARLLGWQPFADCVEIRGRDYTWWSTGRAVTSPRIRGALEHALTIASVEQRLESLTRHDYN